MGFLDDAACGLGYRSSCPSGPTETITVDQCVETDKQMKEEYGDDYLTNRDKFPITATSLQYIKGIGCETAFGWANLADEFCQSLDNYKEQIGGGLTCEDRDRTNNLRSRWCLNEEGPTYISTISTGLTLGTEASNRLKGSGTCVKEKLGNKYDETWTKFCKAQPKDNACTCYNIKNKVCGETPEAAGCGYFKQLEESKDAFATHEERAALADGEEVPSYEILKNKGHCRPRSCESGYIPTNVMSDCAESYNFCGKDLDIRTLSNSQLAINCNWDPNRTFELPDWWGEENTNDFFDQIDEREPPFDKFPLNVLPVTRIPNKFIWKDPNVRNLTYTTSGVSLCCCIIILLIMKSLKSK